MSSKTTNKSMDNINHEVKKNKKQQRRSNDVNKLKENINKYQEINE